MSGVPHEAINVRGAGIDDDQYPPLSEKPSSIDGSGPIFSMYLDIAERVDRDMVETLRGDSDAVLVFTGLFSAVVASLISVSIQDIRPDPQDTSNFYLANIYQILAEPNRSKIPSSLPTSPPTFSPPNYAIWVNSLWFMSLVISLSCALFATLIQQWVRRYLEVVHSRGSLQTLHKRARIRAFFFEGVEKFLLPRAVKILPALLHISLFLFFAGLVIFLCNIDSTIFRQVLSCVGVFMAFYGCITSLPILHHDCPYSTPFSTLVWHIVIGILYFATLVRRLFDSSHLRRVSLRISRDRFHKLLSEGMYKSAEGTAVNSPSEIDARSFMWTFGRLDEDRELERFFSGLPGFRSSKVVSDPLPGLTKEGKQKLFESLMGLLDRTFTSDSLPEPVKHQRAITCAKALDPAEFPNAYSRIFFKTASQYRELQTTEFGRVVRGWDDGRDENTVLPIQATVTGIVAGVRRRDDSWFDLASSELDIAETILQDYAVQGDSLSLAVLIHSIRQQFSHFRKGSWPGFEFSKVLETASKFDVEDTSPELQHDFCALWNQIVLKAQSDNDRSIATQLLRPIRSIYVTLHRGTDCAPRQFSAYTKDLDDILWKPSSYPSCNVPSHRTDSTPHRPYIHDISSSPTLVHTVLHDVVELPPGSLSSSLYAPSQSSLPGPLTVNETFTDVPQLDHDISAPVSTRFAHGTTIESRIPTTPSDPATAHVTQGGVDTFARIVPVSTPEPSTPNTPLTPKTSISPPDDIVVQRTADRRTPSNVPDVPSSPSPTRALGNRPPTETRSSMLTPASPRPSHPRPPPAPDPGAGAEGEGSARAALHKERDALDTPLAIQENIPAAPDLPPLSPSLPPITDEAILGPSRRSPGAEYTGNHSLHPSHGQDDIV